MSVSAPTLTHAFLDPSLLAGLCREVDFAPGERLRTRGLLSIDMYLLTAGEVDIIVDGAGGPSQRLIAGRGSPIGEIGFLTGVPATATVTARTPVRALYIDNPAWRTFEQRRPEEAVAFYRQLAEIVEGRTSYNLLHLEQTDGSKTDGAIEIVLCRQPQQLFQAQRIRYQIYCEELGRTSPYADPVERVIADELDATGHVLLALHNSTPIATMRMNLARDGGLGVLEGLYGMAQFPSHPHATGICTKFIVKKEHRFGKAAFQLMATAIEMAERYEVSDCFMDCVSQLMPFYLSVGFARSAPPFLHHENGRSHPLRLDVTRYAKRISRLAGIAVRNPLRKGS